MRGVREFSASISWWMLQLDLDWVPVDLDKVGIPRPSGRVPVATDVPFFLQVIF